jgi:hypothetical protein
MDLSSNGLLGIENRHRTSLLLGLGSQGGIMTNTNVPTSNLYTTVFLALGASAGIVYGAEER